MPIKFNKELVTIEDKELSKVPDIVFEHATHQFYYLRIKKDTLKAAIKTDIVNKEGKFFKRLQKYLTNTYKERMQSGPMSVSYYSATQLAAHLNNFRVEILDKAIMSFNGFSFQFTDKFDWCAGDFGDPGSCFFDDMDQPKDYIVSRLEGNNFRAIKLYKGTKGIGRALLLPDSLCHRKDDVPIKGWLLMNSYGLSLNRIADVLKNYWHVQATEIVLRDSSLRGDDMYINNDTAIYLGPKVLRKRKTLYMRSTELAYA